MAQFILVGSGVASIAAAEAIRKHDSSSNILVISDEAAGYYSRPGLAYYLTGELPEKLLDLGQSPYVKNLRLQFMQARVVRIDPEAHSLRLWDGTTLAYDRLLIAVGAEAMPINTPGVDLQGVFKLDCLQDAQSIVQYARRARHAIVVGGGITALELAEGLLARGLKVTYLLRGDRYWGNVLDHTESRLIEGQLRTHGVTILYQTSLASIQGKNGRVAGIRTTDGRELRCELLAYAVGIRPRIELAQASGIRVERGVIVNEYMQSSAPDVFAAGDIAQVYDPLTGKYVIDSLWDPAREQGAAAGMNMVGVPEIYQKKVAFNVTRLANLTTTIIGTIGHGQDDDLQGIARGDSEVWREIPDAIAAQSDFSVNHVRIMVGGRTILGAILIGDQTLSRPLLHIVKDQIDILPIRQQLLAPQAPIAEILAQFWTEQVNHYAGSTHES